MSQAGSSEAAATLKAPFKARESSLSPQPEVISPSSKLHEHLLCGLIITPSTLWLFCLSERGIYLKHLSFFCSTWHMSLEQALQYFLMKASLS